MAKFVITAKDGELVNLDNIEAVFIKKDPAVWYEDPANTGSVIARGTSTYVLYTGLLSECNEYLDDLEANE